MLETATRFRRRKAAAEREAGVKVETARAMPKRQEVDRIGGMVSTGCALAGVRKAHLKVPAKAGNGARPLTIVAPL